MLTITDIRTGEYKNFVNDSEGSAHETVVTAIHNGDVAVAIADEVKENLCTSIGVVLGQ